MDNFISFYNSAPPMPEWFGKFEKLPTRYDDRVQKEFRSNISDEFRNCIDSAEEARRSDGSGFYSEESNWWLCVEYNEFLSEKGMKQFELPTKEEYESAFRMAQDSVSLTVKINNIKLLTNWRMFYAKYSVGAVNEHLSNYKF